MCCLTVHYNSGKKRLVQLAVLSGWHYQNKSYPVVEISCDSSIILSFFKILFKFYFEKLFKIIKKKFIKMSLVYLLFDFFWWQQQQQLFSPPPPPLTFPLQTEIVVQFYPWSDSYFLLFSTNYHTSPYPKTYLPWQQGKLPVKESRDGNLSCRFWRLSIFTPPPPDCQKPTTPFTPPPCPQIDPAT